MSPVDCIVTCTTIEDVVSTAAIVSGIRVIATVNDVVSVTTGDVIVAFTAKELIVQACANQTVVAFKSEQNCAGISLSGKVNRVVVNGSTQTFKLTIEEGRVFNGHTIDYPGVYNTVGSIKNQRVNISCRTIADVGDRISITGVIISNYIVTGTTRDKLVGTTTTSQCAGTNPLI